MKKSIYVSALAIMVIVALFSSCKKTSPSPSQPSFTANITNINSASFVSVSTNSYLTRGIDTVDMVVGGQSVNYFVGKKSLSINAQNSSGQNISIVTLDWRDSTIGNGMRTGSYYFNPTQGPCNSSSSFCTGAFVLYNNLYYQGASASGAVVISSCDSVNHKVTGTFFGTVTDGSGDTLNLTNGTFTNVSYTVVP